SAYELINNRYETLLGIIDSGDSEMLEGARIFVQGSIGLGTAIKPLKDGTVDADAIVWLPNAKNANPDDVLEAIYQRFNEGSKVRAKIEPLRRGIRVVYADESPGFHIDVTP